MSRRDFYQRVYLPARRQAHSDTIDAVRYWLAIAIVYATVVTALIAVARWMF